MYHWSPPSALRLITFGSYRGAPSTSVTTYARRGSAWCRTWAPHPDTTRITPTTAASLHTKTDYRSPARRSACAPFTVQALLAERHELARLRRVERAVVPLDDEGPELGRRAQVVEVARPAEDAGADVLVEIANEA